MGKSSLLVRLTDNRFLSDSEPTVGVEFGSQIIPLDAADPKSERIKVQVWDTAGAESFRSITRSYYRGAAGALLVYNVAHRASFEHAQGWLEDVRKHAEEGVSIVLVGNMRDLVEDEEVAEAEDVEETDTPADASPTDEGDSSESQSKASKSHPKAEERIAPKKGSPSSSKSGKRVSQRKVSVEEAEAFAEREG